jgi:hypothetical protein
MQEENFILFDSPYFVSQMIEEIPKERCEEFEFNEIQGLEAATFGYGVMMNKNVSAHLYSILNIELTLRMPYLQVCKATNPQYSITHR